MSPMDADLGKQLDDLRYCLALSTRYHERRERWFDGWDRLAKAIAVVGGASTVTTLVADGGVKTWIAVTITLSSAVTLVFDFSGKARRHYDLRKRYLALEAEVIEAPAEQLRRFEARHATIEIDEPPRLSTLVQVCQNELAQVRQEQIHPVPWLKALLANFLDLPATARRETPPA